MYCDAKVINSEALLGAGRAAVGFASGIGDGVGAGIVGAFIARMGEGNKGATAVAGGVVIGSAAAGVGEIVDSGTPHAATNVAKTIKLSDLVSLPGRRIFILMPH